MPNAKEEFDRVFSERIELLVQEWVRLQPLHKRYLEIKRLLKASGVELTETSAGTRWTIKPEQP